MDRELMSKVGQGRRAPLLRFYDFPDEAVVLGLSQEEEKYVNISETEKDGVPILRRFSGGGTVFLTKGCVVYSVIAPIKPPFKRFDVMGAYKTVFAPVMEAFAGKGLELEFHEPCDLAIGGRKVAGNAQSQRHGAILIHGSFLIDPDLARIARYLKEPDIRPDYRDQRRHEDFLLPLADLGFTAQTLRQLLKEAWC